MKCAWCSGNETAEYIGVFGSLTTMDTWDVRLCKQHADTVRYQTEHDEPIWAPLHHKQPSSNQSYYADDWMIQMICPEQ